MAGPDIEVQRRPRLTEREIHAVQHLVELSTDIDGVRPLSEHVMLHLRYGGDEPTRNLLVWQDDELAGYAHLDTTDVVAGASAELAVAPSFRRRGVGRALVQALADDAGDGRLRLWSHGAQPAASALAESMGFKQERVLWQMRRSLFAPVPAPQWPTGVEVRTFVVGQDEEEWLAVNNRSFAEHPEQGGWSLDDLRMRENEPWFDPEGFFLAVKDGHVVGFHWTKIHGARSQSSHPHDHEPIGEVYVVGVDPSMQGQHLGPALTLRGLQHLRAVGLPQVMLYVDDTNTNAIGVYERLGFAKWDVDICFRRQ
ncbi:MAG TPA: mycothiol synthase [Mycobacteriales bacterium]|nr:mycothiol synthase [Mycobacteriales bacterium]